MSIVELSKSKYRLLMGLANDEIGYIIPKRQWDEKPPFCYGLKKSQYGEINSLGPDTAVDERLLGTDFGQMSAGGVLVQDSFQNHGGIAARW